MPQKLILPINNAVVTASIDTEQYKKVYGFTHCGTDIISSKGVTTLYASGDGTVVATGTDSVVGNVVVLLYKDAYNHRTGISRDIVVRCFHLARISCTQGQTVNKDTVVGLYGATGQYVDGAHLHIEADTDTKYPLYTPTLSRGSLLKGTSQGAYAFTSAKNTTVNVVDYFHCKSSSPDRQTWTTRNTAYIRDADKVIPVIL